MNKILIPSVCILLFSLLFVNFVYADETSSESEVAIPDLVINFNNWIRQPSENQFSLLWLTTTGNYFQTKII